MAGKAKGGSPGARRGYARSGSGTARPDQVRRGAGFWALIAGAAVVVLLIVGVVATSLGGGGSTNWVEKGSGGSWTNVDPAWVRAGYRNKRDPGSRTLILGFRCARAANL